MSIKRCTRCGTRTQDYVTLSNGSVSVTVCRTHVPVGIVPSGARYVALSGRQA